ncbi:hypothetical protein GGR07_002819 [Bacteroides pyogenes]|nr:hypothetical protein [Bacteroides pyogenes]
MFLLENKLIKSRMLNNHLNFESHFSLSHTTNNFVDTARVNHDFEGSIYPSPNGLGETGDVPHSSNDKGLEINERINLDYRLSANHETGYYTYNTKTGECSQTPIITAVGVPSSLVAFE